MWGFSNILQSLFEAITWPLLLRLGFESLNFPITLERRHFVPCCNHFKYADTMSGQGASNFSYSVYIIGSLVHLFWSLKRAKGTIWNENLPKWIYKLFSNMIKNKNNVYSLPHFYCGRVKGEKIHLSVLSKSISLWAN